MTTHNLIIEVMVWALLGLIAFLFTIPSVSSYLLEKITGIKEEENFDLSGMIKQNEELLKMKGADKNSSAIEIAISLSEDERLQQLLHEFQWEAGPLIDLTLKMLSDKTSRDIQYSEFRGLFKKLYHLDSIEENLTLEKFIDLLLNEINDKY
jgi:hypothetical protein